MRTGLISASLILGMIAGCASDDLPGPPIILREVVPREPDSPDYGAVAHGLAEIYLTPHDASHTFWHKTPEGNVEWGTIALTDVTEDGTVVIDLSGTQLRAKPGRTFPGTGIKVIASHPTLNTALLRTRVVIITTEDR